MKNLDLFSRRILVSSVGLSMVLLSTSLFIFSLKNVTGAEAKNPYQMQSALTSPMQSATYQLEDSTSWAEDDPENIRAIQAFGIGFREGKLYFGILYNNNTIGLHQTTADSEDVLPW